MSRRDFNSDVSSGLILAGEVAAIAVLCLVAFALMEVM